MENNTDFPVQDPVANAYMPTSSQNQQYNSVQRPNPTIFNLIKRIFSILLSIFIILFGIINLLIFLTQLGNIFGILNQLLFHTTYLDFGGQIGVIQYLTPKLLTLPFSILLISSGFLIIAHKSLGKKLFLAALLIVLLQAILGAILYSYSLREQSKSEEEHRQWQRDIQTVDKSTVTDLSTIWELKDPQLCKNIKNYRTRWNCIVQFEDDSLFTLDYCSDLTNEHDKNLCMSDVAESQKDKNICYTIPDTFRKNACIADVAVKTKDESLCSEVENIQDLQNTCIVDVGEELNDPSYCERASNQGKKDLCYNNLIVRTYTQFG